MFLDTVDLRTEGKSVPYSATSKRANGIRKKPDICNILSCL